jgi:hypothetical protein
MTNRAENRPAAKFYCLAADALLPTFHGLLAVTRTYFSSSEEH